MDPIFEGLGRKKSPALPEPPEYIKKCMTALEINPPRTQSDISTFLEYVKEREGARRRNQMRATQKVPLNPVTL